MLKSKPLRGLETAWLQKQAAGKTPILLFLHGCPDSPETWGGQLEHFGRQGYAVVAPYARGIAPSAPARDPGRYGLEAIALDHLEILRAVDPAGERPVIVLAHDIGGIHAWKLARLLGPRLAGLVLINAPDLSQMARRLSQPRQVLKSWYIALFQLPKVPEWLLERWESRLIAWSRDRKKTGMPTDTPVSIAPFVNQYRQAARAIPGALREGGPPLNAPALVICSREDAFLEAPTQDELERLASDVTIRVIEGNHWVHHHEAPRVNGLIDRFLEEKIR